MYIWLHFAQNWREMIKSVQCEVADRDFRGLLNWFLPLITHMRNFKLLESLFERGIYTHKNSQ